MPALPNPIEALTAQDFLDLFDRILPPGYIDPLKSPGPGYEALQAFAKLAVRLSLAVERLGSMSQVLTSTGGSLATGTVELYRPAPNAEGIDVVVKAGSLVKSGRGGRIFATVADVTFAAAALGPFSVGVVAVAKGYEWNEPGPVLAADGTLLEGEIDTIEALVESPDYGDATILVRQTGDDAAGGEDAALDQHGSDRNILRLTNEADASYRGRVRALPDNISPDAVDRAMIQLSANYPISYDFIETWDITYQTCWDAPGEFISGSNFNPNLFCFDDPRSASPFRNRWLDESDYRGAFIIVLSALPAIADVGFAYDDASTAAGDLLTAAGTRAFGAFDMSSSFVLAPVGGYDGFDLPRQAVYKGVWDTLQAIKAAGISAAVELEGE
jgi:hypothetical protein